MFATMKMETRLQLGFGGIVFLVLLLGLDVALQIRRIDDPLVTVPVKLGNG